MSLPVIAIVGRPNVGKSTLFNALTRSNQALVHDQPGVTRDRIFGETKLGETRCILIDTGGIGHDTQPNHLNQETVKQAQLAIAEADVLLFLVDARAGLTNLDQELANYLRKLDTAQAKPVLLVVNKIDGSDPDLGISEFYRLSFGEPIPIAAAHRRGIQILTEQINQQLAKLQLANMEPPVVKGIKVAIVGRPNVGKSTLVNRILGEERVIVYDEPGTTRDSIYIPFERYDEHYVIVDTAGVRRRSRIDEVVEKFSVSKTLQAISDANVVIFVLNAVEGLSEQDLHLLGYIRQSGRGLIIACNKWDGLEHEKKTAIKDQIERRLSFVNYAKIYFISALHGTGVGLLFEAIQQSYACAMQSLATTRLTKILQAALQDHQPPLVRGRRIKLRYAHAGGKNPPRIIIHGNQTEAVPESYQRYLEHYFQRELKMVGTPLELEFKTSFNPFATQGKKRKGKDHDRK